MDQVVCSIVDDANRLLLEFYKTDSKVSILAMFVEMIFFCCADITHMSDNRISSYYQKRNMNFYKECAEKLNNLVDLHGGVSLRSEL